MILFQYTISWGLIELAAAGAGVDFSRPFFYTALQGTT
jgi:hypothetical protein